MRVPFLIAAAALLCACGPQGPSQADIMAGRDGTEGQPEQPPPPGDPVYGGDAYSGQPADQGQAQGQPQPQPGSTQPNAIPTPYGASGSPTPPPPSQ